MGRIEEPTIDETVAEREAARSGVATTSDAPSSAVRDSLLS